MILVTKLNKQKFILNSDLIETIEETPDTMITLTNGKLYIVRERAEELIEQIIGFRRSLNFKE